jgi:hypothetical protein
MPDIHELAQHMKDAHKELLELTLSAHVEIPVSEGKIKTKMKKESS